MAPVPTTLSPRERTTLRRYFDERGDERASRAIGVSRGSAMRALAGSPVRRGTIALMRIALVHIDADGDQAAS